MVMSVSEQIKERCVLYYRRAPPGKCHYTPVPVQVKSKLKTFKPKESRSSGLSLLILFLRSVNLASAYLD